MYQKISKYRSAIMGVAILWIVWYHSRMVFGSELLTKIKDFGYGGVDIFLFVSGFGLYCSLRKEDAPAKFYKKRIAKIFPAYIPVLVLFVVLSYTVLEVPNLQVSDLPGIIVANVTGINYWIGSKISFNWYIACIFMLYAVAPFVFPILKEGKKKSVCFLFLAAFLIVLPFIGRDYLMAGVTRLPVFLVGMVAGKLFCEQQKLKWWMELCLYLGAAVAGVCLLWVMAHKPEYLWSYGLHWFPFIVIAPASIILLSRMFGAFEKVVLGRGIKKLFAFLGEASLEIYLLHIVLFELFYKNTYTNMEWLGIIVLMLGAGILYHFIIKRVTVFLVVKGNKTEEKNGE